MEERDTTMLHNVGIKLQKGRKTCLAGELLITAVLHLGLLNEEGLQKKKEKKKEL